MKKIHILILFAVFLLIIPMSLAYVQPIKHNNISFKFYIDVDKQDCFLNVDIIPKKYLKTIKQINILPYKNGVAGQYYWNTGIIDLFDSCDFDTLVHEIAHNCQQVRGDYLWEGYGHTGNFNICQEEIWNSIKE